MTMPVVPPPAVAPTPTVSNQKGEVYLTNPRTGEVQEVPHEIALDMLQSGWVPNDKESADAIRAAQIPAEVAAEQPALGKIGYGLTRGALSPLVDYALPAGNRVAEVLGEDSPWLMGGSEAVGMLGSAALGVGPAAALEEGAGRVAAELGAGNGLVRTAFGRAAAGALEGGAYGVMGAVTQAHDENTPLTAQRFSSEVMPGLLFGGVLGGGLGAMEGLGKTLPNLIARGDAGKLDEIFRAGVSDEDALRMAQREYGVKDPGALTRFQALASGGDVSPERLELLKASGEVGERARGDAFASVDQLAQAERDVVDKGNDYLLGREEAMRQVTGNVKGKHIADMVGAGEADAADIGKLVRDQLVQGDWAESSARREQFVDHLLDTLDEDQTRELERSLGVRDAKSTVPDAGAAQPVGSLRERLLTGLTQGHNEVIQGIESALSGAKLTDDQLRSFGLQGSWSHKPLEFIQRARSQLENLQALRGVNDSLGDLKKIKDSLDYAEQSVLRDPRRMAAHSLDSLKKRLADFAEPGERLGAGSGVPAAARNMYEDLRQILEDPTVWGPKFAGFQARTNALMHQNLGVAGEFDRLFVKEIGKPDPDAPWRNARVVDSEKVSKGLAEMSEPKQLEQLNRIRAHLDDQKKFFQEQLDSLKLGGKEHVRIQAGIKQIDQVRDAIDRAVYLNTAQRQGRALLGFGPLGSGWEARAALGAVVGGPVGAVAGLGVSAALNPGKMLQFRAISERMAEATNSRVWRGISKILGLRFGDVARETAGFIGKAAAPKTGKVAGIISLLLSERGDKRAKTYSQTVQQLYAARQQMPALDAHVSQAMPMLDAAFPGMRTQMLAQTQRGLDYVLAHLPVTPKARLYGEQAAPLSDMQYENFARMTIAATDPTSVLEMAQDGELTPQAMAAAEAAAPEMVAYFRSEMARAISDHGVDKIGYDKLISASLLIGSPLDESLEPENIAVQQATHQKRNETYMQQKQEREPSGGETGVNQKYASEGDQIEAGVPPR